MPTDAMQIFLPAYSSLEREELLKIISEISGSQSKRNIAMITLAHETGLRVSELITLRAKNVSKRDGVPCKIIVTKQKGETLQEREIALSQEAVNSILILLHLAKKKGPVKPSTFLAQSQRYGNTHIGREHFQHILKEAAKAAKIQEKVTTQTLRKTFAINSCKRISEGQENGDPIIRTTKNLGIKHINRTPINDES